MKRLAVLNIVGLTKGLIDTHGQFLKDWSSKKSLSTFEPVFPAVTTTAQSSYLTGVSPEKHAIVGNGWYDRDAAECKFWKQSNHLVKSKKVWEVLRESDPEFTCAKIFWWYNMYSSADYTVTPRPMYPADGSKVFDVYTQPMGLREELKNDLGDFPFFTFWGPNAGIDSSKWIAESAKWIEDKKRPNLNLVYLPHLDYVLQQEGPNGSRVAEEFAEIESVVEELIQFFESRDVEVMLVSEYGISEVSQAVHLNRLFREQGWITIKDELGLEQLDCGASKVFAIADHQVAHVYVNDQKLTNQVERFLKSVDGVDTVHDGKVLFLNELAGQRAGDFVVEASAEAWFTYYYWLDDTVAPDFARCIDIHRKPGYDPVELFFDPEVRFPKLKLAEFLVKKKLGLKTLLEIIPLDANLVRGSHGRRVVPEHERPVFVGQNLVSHACDVYDEIFTFFQ